MPELANANANDLLAVDYNAIYFTGGHAVMWDFPMTRPFKKLPAIRQRGGIDFLADLVGYDAGQALSVAFKNPKAHVTIGRCITPLGEIAQTAQI